MWHMVCLMLHHRHRQAFTHSSTVKIKQQSGCERMGDCGCSPHLERDPLVLPGFTEGMGEEKDIVYSDSQSQKGKHL